MSAMHAFRIAIAVCAFSIVPAALAQDTQPLEEIVLENAVQLPPNDGLVTDDAQLLTSEQDAALERMLVDYQRETGTDVAIVMMRTLSGASAEDLAAEIREKWGLGQDNQGNSVIILGGYESRDLAIDVSSGLKDKIPQKTAAGLADKVMQPLFREAKYNEMFVEAVDAIKKHIGGEYSPNRYDSMGRSGGILAWFLLLIAIGCAWAGSVFFRSVLPWIGGLVGGLCGMLLTSLYGWWLAIPFLVAVGLGFDVFSPAREQHRPARHHHHRSGGHHHHH
jgi:uncharacterized membrane protein YgcG